MTFRVAKRHPFLLFRDAACPAELVWHFVSNFGTEVLVYWCHVEHRTMHTEQYTTRTGPSAHNVCAEHNVKTNSYLPPHDPYPSIPCISTCLSKSFKRHYRICLHHHPWQRIHHLLCKKLPLNFVPLTLKLCSLAFHFSTLGKRLYPWLSYIFEYFIQVCPQPELRYSEKLDLEIDEEECL